MALNKQNVGEVGAEEAGGSSDQDFLWGHLFGDPLIGIVDHRGRTRRVNGIDARSGLAGGLPSFDRKHSLDFTRYERNR